MKTIVFIVTGIMSTLSVFAADKAELTIGKTKALVMGEAMTDLCRENLVHIFDSANFHLAGGGALPGFDQERVVKDIQRVETGAHIKLTLDQPARIVVEGKVFHPLIMWVSIRESDGLVFDWMFEEEGGRKVALTKPSGDLSMRFSSVIKGFQKKYAKGGAE